MSNEIVPVSPMSLIAVALEKGMDVNSLKGLFDLQERHERNEAAKDYAVAIRGFQAECPPIKQSKSVKDRAGNLLYRFADYDEDVLDQVQPLLSKHGIGITFDFRFEDGLMYTTCHVRVGTHVEDTTVPLAVPQIPNANETQKAGGALAYGKRYSLLAALNIRVHGQDDDAQGMSLTVSGEQFKIMQAQINACKNNGTPINMKKFLDFLNGIEPKSNIDKLEDLPKEKLTRAIAELERKKATVPV